MRKYYAVYFINALLVVCGLVVLFFVANISLGTQEHHEQMIAASVSKYFFGRLLINIIVTLAAVLLIWLLNIMLKKLFKLANLRTVRIAMLQLIVFILSSVVFILIGL